MTDTQQSIQNRARDFLLRWEAMPYRPGVCDCFHLVFAWIFEIAGTHPCPEAIGRYRSAKDGHQILRDMGNTFEEFVSDIFTRIEWPEIEERFAMAGDVGYFADGDQYIMLMRYKGCWVTRSPGGITPFNGTPNKAWKALVAWE